MRERLVRLRKDIKEADGKCGDYLSAAKESYEFIDKFRSFSRGSLVKEQGFQLRKDLSTAEGIVGISIVHNIEDIHVSPKSSNDVDTDSIGRCDVATRSGGIATMMCYQQLPFICKVAAQDAPYDQHCDVYGKVALHVAIDFADHKKNPIPDYRYYSSVGSCYKIPWIPFTWSQAYSKCQAEGAHLLVVNSQAEHDAIFNLTNTEEKVRESRAFYFFFAGFRAAKPLGNATVVFRTIFNQTLEEAGYSGWSEHEPNNALGREFCGCIFKNNGKLNDVDCSQDFCFICEKEVPMSS